MQRHLEYHRSRRHRVTYRLAALLATGLCTATAPAAAPSAYTDALAVVQSSLAAHGGMAPLEKAGGLTITTDGTFDLTTRLQGRSPDRPEPSPITERIAVDLAARRVSYDIAWSNYKYARQHLREVYDAEGRVLYIDKRAGTGGWPPFALVPDARERYRRLLPQLLLDDALDQRATLRYLGRERLDGRDVDTLGYVTAAGDHLALHIDRRSKLLHGATHLFDMELLGDAEMRWEWDGYATHDGLHAPSRLRVYLDDTLLKDVQLSARFGVDEAAFRAPDRITVGEPPAPGDMAAYRDFTPYSQRPGEARQLAPGVFLAPSVRPGFHLFFVEFDDFALAVDAPTGWYEMNQLPPHNFVRDEGSSDLAEKYLRIIKDTLPGKPVRYVALTHHHSDHIGGVRAFIAEGATVLAAAPAAAVARDAATRAHTLRPDRLSATGIAPRIEIVEGKRVISDGNMEVQLIELPAGNPKADGFLVVYLPVQKIMYFTSFIYPLPEDAFPAPESVPLSLWFVRWLDQSGLEPEHIYNVHGRAKVEEWQLQRFRDMLDDDAAVAGEGE